MNNLEILEKATAEVAINLFKMKYPGVEVDGSDPRAKECVSDAVFVINNFMRISSNLALEAANAESDSE